MKSVASTVVSVCAAILLLAASSSAQTEKTLYRFQAGDGVFPNANLVADAAGNLYGTNVYGGAYADGAVFEMLRPTAPGQPWTQTVLHSFDGADGINPIGGVIFDSAGNLYGATFLGGSSNYGTVYELSPPSSGGATWTLTVLYNFQGSPDAGQPADSLTFDAKGNLYGTTEYDGVCCGTVFELSPPSVSGGAWTESVLYSYTGGTDGMEPVGGVVLDAAGNLYGTTFAGGHTPPCTNACGIVFRLSPPGAPGASWTETVLHRFKGKLDGIQPFGGVIFSHGFLYGTTSGGGTSSAGTVYQMVPATGEKKIIYNFGVLFDGQGPSSSLAVDKAGNLYGTTNSGGTANDGTVFRLSPQADGTWAETVLYSFLDQGDGYAPFAGVTVHKSVLYGTTTLGGSAACNAPGGHGCGTVFQLIP